MVYTIAHRGASGTVPENTMLAFYSAIAQGADMIEFDVQITKDEKLVLFHDQSLTRITGDPKGIADYTWDELSSMDVGSWKNEHFASSRIPLFSDVMNVLPSSISLIIEVKPQNKPLERERKLEQLILEILDNTRGVNKGYISVRDIETYQWFHDHCSYSIGLMQKKRSHEEFIELIASYHIPFAQLRIKQYNIDQIKELRATSTSIMVYFADIPKEWNKVIQWGVDGILTNYPGDLRGYLMMNDQLD